MRPFLLNPHMGSRHPHTASARAQAGMFATEPVTGGLSVHIASRILGTRR